MSDVNNVLFNINDGSMSFAIYRRK